MLLKDLAYDIITFGHYSKNRKIKMLKDKCVEHAEKLVEIEKLVMENIGKFSPITVFDNNDKEYISFFKAIVGSDQMKSFFFSCDASLYKAMLETDRPSDLVRIKHYGEYAKAIYLQMKTIANTPEKAV